MHNDDDDSTSQATGAAAHAYSALTPDLVLDALAELGMNGDGRLMALGSYENRVYQVTLEDGARVVAKFYRPGRWSDDQILEEHAFALELAAAEVPMVAPLQVHGRTLHHHAGFSFSVSPWRGGRTPELDDFETLEWIGRFLARIHTVGAERPFVLRPMLDVQTFGIDSRDWLLAHQSIPLDQESGWRKACDEALAIITDKMNARHSFTQLRLHGDCHPGNVLWTPVDDNGHGGPHFVDLDDARMGPSVQDLWMLMSGERAQRSMQLSTLLEGYEQFRDFDRRELALIEPLRTLRLIHYSAWLARRYADPIFPINFPWFGSSDYWRGQTDMLVEQIEAMQEPSLLV
ncbi:serine/threonine protein kinase [Diaphorobacter aerolatus]|uniref:Stress response kinase A n=1 Tax=Diaphorobacter aerolatus TaxID=1288495 RepID=A0A7H0GP39_9BURK|nr:serine/threonine protein kinase [Diaphorobacter aerolatus]QNP50055.1 serine/threonine protein kinase [Diaphorobacter aerolatus]